MSEKTAPESDRSPPAQSIAGSLKAGVPLVTVAAMLIVGYFVGHAPAILVLAGGALIGVIAMFWASLRTLFGETPLSGADAYAIGAPRAEEEQKQAVLRALKDLEFERSVGKISEEDYQALVARYRAEAKRLLRVLDADARPRRQQVEALVSSHLRKEGLLEEGAEAEQASDEAEEAKAKARDDDDDDDDASAAKGKAKSRDDGDDDDDDADEVEAKAKEERAAAAKEQRKKKRGAKAEAAPAAKKAKDQPAASDDGEEPAKPEVKELVCAECGTSNDADAVFCKKCGSRQKPAEGPSAAPEPRAKAADSEAGAS